MVRLVKTVLTCVSVALFVLNPVPPTFRYIMSLSAVGILAIKLFSLANAATSCSKVASAYREQKLSFKALIGLNRKTEHCENCSQAWELTSLSCCFLSAMTLFTCLSRGETFSMTLQIDSLTQTPTRDKARNSEAISYL